MKQMADKVIRKGLNVKVTFLKHFVLFEHTLKKYGLTSETFLVWRDQPESRKVWPPDDRNSGYATEAR